MNDPICTTIPSTPSIPFAAAAWLCTGLHILPQWGMFGVRLLCILLSKQTKRPDSVSWWGGVEGGDRKDAKDEHGGGGGNEHAGRGRGMCF